MRVLRSWRRALFAGLAVVLVGGTAAFGGHDSGSRSGRQRVSALGQASGTPVKVGLITSGGDCDGCGAGAEEPVAQATVRWLNKEKNGLAGHPMTLDVCVDSNDPGKGSDCANQMIRDDVAAVVLGSSGTSETSWKVLHDAGIPVINHSLTQTAILQDPASTFILYDPNAQTVALPIAIAKAKHAKKVSIIVVDVPTATDIYNNDATKRQFKQAGLDLNIVPVPLGAPDMTPQAQRIVADNPDGVVAIIGHDQFCIPALNALQAVGFRGTITTISYCITDATRKAVPGNLLKGMQFGSEAPVGDKKDPSMRQYARVLKKYGSGSIDLQDLPGLTTFQGFGALGLGTQGLQGEVTAASVTAAMKSMKNEVLPGAGGRVFRCNGKATTFGPAICSVSTVAGRLDAQGKPVKYTIENNKPIGD